MSAGFFHGLWTAALGLTFLLIVLDVFWRKSAADFRDAENLPLEDNDQAGR